MTRKLILVPVIHSSLELGSLKKGIEAKAISIYGKKMRIYFKKIVTSYWNLIDDYFKRTSVSRAYQDALISGRELGTKIVEDNAAKGIKNYQILLKLVKRGAELMKTEDKELVLKEYRYWQLFAELLELRKKFGKDFERVAKQDEIKKKIQEFKRFDKDSLIRNRDVYIANRVNKTLKDGEVGVLFIGVEHNIIHRLDPDIVVVQLKERDKVHELFKKFIQKKGEKELIQLKNYLTSPIGNQSV